MLAKYSELACSLPIGVRSLFLNFKAPFGVNLIYFLYETFYGWERMNSIYEFRT